MTDLKGRVLEILNRNRQRKPNPCPVGRKLVTQNQRLIEAGIDVPNPSDDTNSSRNTTQNQSSPSLNGSRNRLQLIKQRRALTRKVDEAMGGDFNQFTMPVPRFNPKIAIEPSCSEESAIDRNSTDSSYIDRILHSPMSDHCGQTFDIGPKTTADLSFEHSDREESMDVESSIFQKSAEMISRNQSTPRSEVSTCVSTPKRPRLQKSEDQLDVDPVNLSPVGFRFTHQYPGNTPQTVTPSIHRFGRKVIDDSFLARVAAPRVSHRKRQPVVPAESDTSVFEDDNDGVKEIVLKPKKLMFPQTPPVGLRRSQRVRIPPVRHWVGEEPIYAISPNGSRSLRGTTRVVVRDPLLIKAKTTDLLKLLRLKSQKYHKN